MWIGRKLSSIEILCIKSFISNGHIFYLWKYDEIETVLPQCIVIKDASEIIPRKNVFCYKNSNQYGHGKGSYAGFSDIFRYKLLYEYGGWWVDMDVVCLKPFDFEEEYVFRIHHDYAVVGNIMKCPKNSELMKLCYERALSSVNENNRDWDLPIKILNNSIIELKLVNYIKDFSNPDSWYLIRSFLYMDYRIPEKWKALHLVNEEWRHNRINKEAIPLKSYIGQLLKKYELWEPSPWRHRQINMLRAMFIGFSVKQIKGMINRLFWKVIRFFKKKS